MPRPAAYPRAFQSGGVWPWTVNDGVTTRHVRFALTNRRRTTFHAAPGILRAFRQTVRAPAPPRRQRNPVYPWWDAKSMARDERAGICGDDFSARRPAVLFRTGTKPGIVACCGTAWTEPCRGAIPTTPCHRHRISRSSGTVSSMKRRLFLIPEQGRPAGRRGLCGKPRPNHCPAAAGSVRLSGNVRRDLSGAPVRRPSHHPRDRSSPG
jgi:hypothetical protein